MTTTLHRESKPKSKNLVVVNKGPGAVNLDRSGHDWDLLEIYFMTADIAAIKNNSKSSDANFIVFEHDRSMRKFAIIKAIFESHSFWQHYENFIFADDDIVPVDCSFDDVFNLFKTTGSSIGQPALSQDSFYSHAITVQNRNFSWRRTNFAEVMCPVMTRDAVSQYLPQFNATISHFGLDFFWSTSEWMNHRGVVILDDTPVYHCRPIGGGIAYEGLSAHDELAQFMSKMQTPIYELSCFGGLSKTISISKIFERGQDVEAYMNPKLNLDPLVKKYHALEKGRLSLAKKVSPDYLGAILRDEDSARVSHFAVMVMDRFGLTSPQATPTKTSPQLARFFRFAKKLLTNS